MATDFFRASQGLCRVGWLLYSLSVALHATTSHGGDAEMDRVRREYPAAAVKLEQFYQQMNGTCVTTKRQKGQPSGFSEVRFATRGQSRKFGAITKLSSNPPKSFEEVYCVGDGTSFAIHRNPDDPQSGWKLIGAGRDGYELTNYNRFGQYFHLPYRIGPATFAEMINSRDRRLTAVDPVTLDRHSCLRLRIEPVAPLVSPSLLVTVDPELGWAVRIMEGFYKPSKMDFTYRAEYGPLHDGLPEPRLMTSHDSSGMDKTCEFKTISFDPTPANEFTLPFYGLPAVDGRAAGAPRGSRPIWLAGVGVGGLALAYGIRRGGKSRQTKPASA